MDSDPEPLDSVSHEKYLDLIADKLAEILSEIKALRKDVQQLPRQISDR